MFGFFKKAAKSKTLNFNVLVPSIMAILSTFGVDLPKEVLVGVMAIGNFILRLVTEEPVAAK